MVKVLDQYEVEYKETYISGTYDQVVMGKMFQTVTINGIKKLIPTGSRGVAYGSINSYQSVAPGTQAVDWSPSVSYRLQPYKEKAGNCRAAKHLCFEERIYDTLTPNPLSCFKANGANVFSLIGGAYGSPGATPGYAGVDIQKNAIIMFDNYIPPEGALPMSQHVGTLPTNTSKAMINPCVDVHWTKSFPFEPRYSAIKRELFQKFTGIRTPYVGSFYNDIGAKVTASFEPADKLVEKDPHDGNKRFGYKPSIPTVNGLIVGTVSKTYRENSSTADGSFYDRGAEDLAAEPPLSGNIYHRWAVDVNLDKIVDVSFGGGGHVGFMPTTGSCSSTDLLKVLFGYGDHNTVFYDQTLTSSSDQTGFARRGTHNWPYFRKVQRTVMPYAGHASPVAYQFPGYELVSSSIWSIGPIIRGWRYGLHSALPDYTAAYYRQGRYGQFRDLLEQRAQTATINENPKIFSQNAGLTAIAGKTLRSQNPVTVKFLNENENLTDPVRTQSQNLSIFATSSLPFFDLQQRNRPDVSPLPNLTLVGFKVDAAGNITI